MKRLNYPTLISLCFLVFFMGCAKVDQELLEVESTDVASYKHNGDLTLQEGTEFSDFEIEQLILSSEGSADYVITKMDGHSYAHHKDQDISKLLNQTEERQAMAEANAECMGSYSSATMGTYPGGRYLVVFFNRNCLISSYFPSWNLEGDFENGDIKFGHGIANSTTSWCAISWPNTVNVDEAQASYWWTFPYFVQVAISPLYNL